MKQIKIRHFIEKRYRLLILLVFLLPLLVIDGLNYFELPDSDLLEEHRVEILIPKGSSLGQISDSLKVHGLINDEKLFKLWAVTFGYDTQLKAGLFDVPAGLNDAQLLEYLTRARAKEINVTLLEGWENNQITSLLSRKLGVSKQVLDSLCVDESFVGQYGIKQMDLTGYLLPDTYAFYWGIKEREILDFLVKRTLSLFNTDSVRHAMKRLDMSREKVITLASIIEGEAILDGERPVIASVYYNRLKRGMRLQADPTIQFIIDGPPRRLLERDLKIDSPYNTYRYAGLPPGPINNPGKSSIIAALFPAETNYLYFVATGDGGHAFSRTLREHNRAKAAFDKVRREVRREQRNKRQN